MNPAHTFDIWSSPVGTFDHVTSADAQSDNVDNAGLATMPWLVAFDGEDSFVHARRAAGVAAAAAATIGPVESAGEGGGGKPERSHAFYNSALITPLSKPFNTDSSAHFSPAVAHAHAQPSSPCQYKFKPPGPFLRPWFTDLISPRLVPCEKRPTQSLPSNRLSTFRLCDLSRGHTRAKHHISDLRRSPHTGSLAAASWPHCSRPYRRCGGIRPCGSRRRTRRQKSVRLQLIL